MTRRLKLIVISVTGILWLGFSGFALSSLWHFESKPGEAAAAPTDWPKDAKLARRGGLPTLLVMIHPRCPCSRASLEELIKIQTDCQGKMRTIVLVVVPPGAPKDFSKTDLIAKAAKVPGVDLVNDIGGGEALRFGCKTSGQAVLYSATGKLLFAGGITGTRGEVGDNQGRSVITSVLLGSLQRHVSSTPVYGCPLFDVAMPGKGNQCTK